MQCWNNKWCHRSSGFVFLTAFVIYHIADTAADQLFCENVLQVKVALRCNLELHDPEPVAERIAVGATNRDLFTINNKLMNFDHADMPDTHHI